MSPTKASTKRRAARSLAKKADRKAAFLKALEEHFELEPSCRVAGIDRKTVYRWRQADAEFDKAVQEARKPAIEQLKATNYLRAMNGFDPTTGRQGPKLVDDRTASLYSFFVTKAYDPAYKDSYRPAIDVQDLKITLAIPAPPSFMRPQLPAGDVIDGEVVEEK